ncbi:MAG: TolC family protein [Acidobacteria bacterium]|nr:TolC family protein [Acidobacteriota bacterium]
MTIRSKWMRGIAVTLVVASLVMEAGCAGADKQAIAKQPPMKFPVTAVAVQTRSVPIFQEFIGATFALDTIQVNSRVNRYIEKWLFRPGDFVKQGQLLYVIDQRTYRAEVQRVEAEAARVEAQLVLAREGVDVLRAESELAQAEASLIKAEQDVARVRPLVKEKALPEQDLDAVLANHRIAQNNYRAREANVHQLRLTQKTSIQQAEAGKQAVKAALTQAPLDLSFTEIRAVADGRIGETRIQVGGLAAANSPTPLTLISPLDPIYVEFTVTERDYLDYAMDQNRKGTTAREALKKVPLELLLADGSVYPQRGEFRFADRAVDGQTGTLKLIGAFPNPNRLLLPGPGVAAPIFNSGALRANVRAAKVAAEAAIIQLERTFQVALRETSDSLIGVSKTRERRLDQERLLVAVREANRLSRLLYEGGVSSYLQVLDTDRNLFDAEVAMAQLQREELLAVVRLYRALGGGWQ